MELRNIQNIQYNILRELDRVCKKHNIQYFIAQGTLLGAVRHKGFIPWDDDVDVILDYKEIDRLMKVFKAEANIEYLLANHHVEKHYPLTWSKIRDTKTISMPVRYKKIPMNWGICIDLFPMYPISDNKVFRAIELFIFKLSRKILLSEFVSCDEGASFITKLFAALPCSVRRLCADMGTTLFKLHKKATHDVFLVCRGGKVVDRSIIYGEGKTLFFEDGEYPVPSDYHEFLTLMYGDYMTLPPEEERKGHELNLGEIEWSIK